MSGFYSKARKSFTGKLIDWLNDDIRLVLVTSSYVADLTATGHEFLADITAGYRVATSSAFTGKTNTDGVLDADDPKFTALTGSAFSQGVIYQHTGVDATARLILQKGDASNLPYTPIGNDFYWVFDNGVYKIGKI